MFPNFPKARVAQVRFPVLTKQQVGVHGNLSSAQAQRKDLVRQKEKSSLPWFSLANPSHIFSVSPLLVFESCFAKPFSLFKRLNFCVGGTLLFWVSKRLESLPAFA